MLRGVLWLGSRAGLLVFPLLLLRWAVPGDPAAARDAETVVVAVVALSWLALLVVWVLARRERRRFLASCTEYMDWEALRRVQDGWLVLPRLMAGVPGLCFSGRGDRAEDFAHVRELLAEMSVRQDVPGGVREEIRSTLRWDAAEDDPHDFWVSWMECGKPRGPFRVMIA